MNSPQAQEKYADLKKTYHRLPFNRYQADIYSQNGEDGVIAEVLTRLGLLNDGNWCVEFGAWDGKHLSNTFAFVERTGFHAVYIEGDETRFNDLLSTCSHFPRIVPFCAFVEGDPKSSNSLDGILRQTPITTDFALLSIDIDSYDLDVWESMTSYQPKVVVIEINSSVPPGIVWRHSKNTPGNTFTATCNVAKHKGYTLICHTGNLIFVRDDQVGRLNIEERYLKYPELLYLSEVYCISGGTLSGLPSNSKRSSIRFVPRFARPFVKRLLGLS